jgi:probable HAF family extracellular repeat protein
MLNLIISAVCQLLLSGASGQVAADKAQSRYTITDLGTLGGHFSDASAINNSGQVVGDASLTGDTASYAFLYRNGTMTDLGTLPGGSVSQAHAINNHGEIVGGSRHR